MMRRKKKIFCPILPGNSSGLNVDNTSKLKSKSTTATSKEKSSNTNKTSSESSESKNKKTKADFSKESCLNISESDNDVAANLFHSNVVIKDLEVPDENIVCQNNPNVLSKDEDLLLKTHASVSSSLSPLDANKDLVSIGSLSSSVSEIHAVINSENTSCTAEINTSHNSNLLNKVLSQPSTINDGLHTNKSVSTTLEPSDNALKSSKQPVLKGRRKKVAVTPNMAMAGSRFSSKKCSKSFSPLKNNCKTSSTVEIKCNANEIPIAATEVVISCSTNNYIEKTSAKMIEVNQSNPDENVSKLSYLEVSPAKDNCNSITNKTTEISLNTSSCSTTQIANQEEKKQNSSFLIDKPNKNFIKSRRQIIEEHFGWEPKVIRHRNALKKIKSMNLDKLPKDGGDWSNSVRNSLLMSDLIYCNPPAGSARELGIRSVLRKIEEKRNDTKPTENSPRQKQPSPEPEQPSSPQNNVIAPQIRLNEDGSIVLDEESLFINSSNAETVVNNSPAVYENNFGFVTQASFRRFTNKRSHWSEKQTRKFYEALKVVGADFGLMSAMFRHRDDKELRRKFHLERKKNSLMVDEALKQQHLSKWTNDMFMPLSSSDEENNKNTPKRKSTKRRKRKDESDVSNSAAKTVALSVDANAI